ncbi:MAG: TRAP transporter small permease [Pseudomonadota bacterium]|nr:TRAP transporter small permease [Pseudomonadota bacterium]
MNKALKRILSTGPEDVIVFVVFWLMTICVILQFFTRYVLNNSLAWTEELASLSLVVIVYFGIVVCERRNSQIRIELVGQWLPAPVAGFLKLLVDLICLAFYVYLVTLFYRYTQLMGGDMMTTARVSLSPLYYAVTIAFAGLSLRTAIRIGSTIFDGWRTRPTDPE